MQKSGITWKNVRGVCIDGAPAMLEPKSEFWALVQRKAPDIMFTHSFIYREGLAFETLLSGLPDVRTFKAAVKK